MEIKNTLLPLQKRIKIKDCTELFYFKSKFNVYHKLGDIITFHNSTLLTDVYRAYLLYTFCRESNCFPGGICRL